MKLKSIIKLFLVVLVAFMLFIRFSVYRIDCDSSDVECIHIHHKADELQTEFYYMKYTDIGRIEELLNNIKRTEFYVGFNAPFEVEERTTSIKILYKTGKETYIVFSGCRANVNEDNEWNSYYVSPVDKNRILNGLYDINIFDDLGYEYVYLKVAEFYDKAYNEKFSEYDVQFSGVLSEDNEKYINIEQLPPRSADFEIDDKLAFEIADSILKKSYFYHWSCDEFNITESENINVYSVSASQKGFLDGGCIIGIDKKSGRVIGVWE